MTRTRLRRIFWIGAAAILIVAALVALGAVLRGEFSDTDGRVLVTLATLLYTGAAALAALALLDQGRARRLAGLVLALAPVSFALVVWAVWSFTFDGESSETADKLAWSAVILLLAGLLATTSLLVARTETLIRLAAAAGTTAAVAAVVSAIAVWAEPEGDVYMKVVSAAWILAALGFLLVPVVQRYSSAGAEQQPERVLDALDGIELVATRGPGIDPRLAAGERLVLRHRS